MHAALTSVLCAIWLAIESNKTLTLRVEIFRREILLSKGIKNYEMFFKRCCNVFRSTVICLNMAAYYATGQ